MINCRIWFPDSTIDRKISGSFCKTFPTIDQCLLKVNRSISSTENWAYFREDLEFLIWLKRKLLWRTGHVWLMMMRGLFSYWRSSVSSHLPTKLSLQSVNVCWSPTLLLFDVPTKRWYWTCPLYRCSPIWFFCFKNSEITVTLGFSFASHFSFYSDLQNFLQF